MALSDASTAATEASFPAFVPVPQQGAFTDRFSAPSQDPPALAPHLWLPHTVSIRGATWTGGHVEQRYTWSADGADVLRVTYSALRQYTALPLWLQPGAHFRVLPIIDPGVLSLDAENPPLSFLDCGVPGGPQAPSAAGDGRWADNWLREILARVPGQARRRAAILLAVSALAQAARTAGRVLKTTLRHAAAPLWEWLRSDAAR